MLDTAQCLELLRCHQVARLGLVVDGRPEVLPFSYRLADATDGPVTVVIVTAAHGAVARASTEVCLQLDDIDPERRTAWSVVAHGRMRRPFPGERLAAPHPWPDGGRRELRVIELATITGRTFVAEARPAAGYSVEWQVG